MEYEKNLLDWQGAQLPYIGFDELTHFCLTPDHEVLTDKGFKNITDIKKGDKVASLSSDQNIQYKIVDDTYLFKYDGNLKVVNQRNGVSFRCTPNHKAVVMKQLPNRKKTKERGGRFNGWKFKEVGSIKSCYIPRSGLFTGKEVDFFYFKRPTNRGHGVNSNSIEKVSMDTWLEYLGWYISEGSSFTSNSRTKSPIVSVRQTKMFNHPELCNLHEKLGFRWRYRKDGNYFIFSRQLFDVLKPMGDAYQKRVPEFIFSLSVRQQRIFFDAFVKGDGHVTKNNTICFGLCNSLLIDDLQRIGFNIGLTGAKGYSKTKTGFDVYRLTLGANSGYNLVKKGQITDEYYNGNVHCLNVRDNHNFYIRHNGRCSWTGNSRNMFFYLLTRNRSACGVRPYVRATCNPDPDGWVYEMIQWWIDQETGFPIPERDGVVRYMMVDGENYIWGDTVDEVLKKAAHLVNEIKGRVDVRELVKSVSFISGNIYENVELLKVNPSYLGNLLAQVEETKAQLLHGNWKVVISDKDIYDYPSFGGLFDNIMWKRSDRPRKRMTADIAMQGSNKMVVGYWEDGELANVEHLDKSDGPQVIKLITEVAQYYGVANTDICFDADGVGAFTGGYVPGAIAFHGGAAALEAKNPTNGKWEKENYFNLRTQCYYRSGLAVARGERKISPLVASKMYSDKETYRQRFYNERKAIKKEDKTPDGKLKIISKDEMKAKLNGDSPDVMDMFMMFEMFHLKRQMTWAAM